MRVAALLVLTACGRIGFDARSDAGDGGNVGDGTAVDAAMFSGTRSAYLKADTPLAADQLGSAVALSADGTTLAAGGFGSMNGSGVVYIFTRDADVWTQQARIVPTVVDAGDNFGVSVALSADGNTLAVGAFLEDSASATDPTDNNADGAGAAYVFVRSGSTWSQQAYLKASNLDLGDGLGQAIGLSADGNTLAVSAHDEASGMVGNPGDNSASMAGAVYVFTRSGTAWNETAYLKADNAGAGDTFGESLDIASNGSMLVVGAYLESSAAMNVNGDGTNDFTVNSGAAYVFDSPPAWTQRAYVKAFNTGMSDQFGIGVSTAANGDVLIGASLEDSASTTDQGDDSLVEAGAAYTYGHVGAGWQPGSYLKATTPADNALFGLRVSISDAANTIAVGAVGEDSSAGAAYVFGLMGSTWQLITRLTASNRDAGDNFGTVVLSGDGTTLAVGAYLEDSAGPPGDNSATDSGAIYVFW